MSLCRYFASMNQAVDVQFAKTKLFAILVNIAAARSIFQMPYK